MLVATAFVPHFILASSQSSSSQVFCRQAAYSSGLHLKVSDKTAHYLPKRPECVWKTLILPRLLFYLDSNLRLWLFIFSLIDETQRFITSLSVHSESQFRLCEL